MRRAKSDFPRPPPFVNITQTQPPEQFCTLSRFRALHVSRWWPDERSDSARRSHGKIGDCDVSGHHSVVFDLEIAIYHAKHVFGRF